MESYHEQLGSWRDAYRERLLGDQGWLRVAGLSWLEPGTNSLAIDPDRGIVVAPGGEGEGAGTIHLEGAHVRLQAPAGAPFRVGDAAVAGATFTLDRTGNASPIGIGRFTLVVIRRGDRIGIRHYDPEAPSFLAFAGLDWFPIDPAFRVTARFEPFAEPRRTTVATIDGAVREAEVPGRATFTLAGAEAALLPILSGDRFLFVFRDGTSGVDTYAACRFLSTPPPTGAELVLDFNRATNPPCAYTAFATCPLPLPENRLDLPVTAGERRFRPAPP